MKLSSSTEDESRELAERIRLLALIEAGFALMGTPLKLLFVPGETAINLAIAVLFLLLAGGLYAFRTTSHAEVATYINLVSIATIIALIDPVTGTLSGATWVLFQIWPPIATLVLHRPRATVILALFTLLLFVVSGLFSIVGVIPVQLLLPPGTLITAWILHVLVLIGLSVAITGLGTKERRSLEATREVQGELEARVRELDHANHALERTNTTLFQQNAEKQQLLDLVAALEVPAIPLAEGLLLVPIIGALDYRRATALMERLLEEVHTHRARQVILDLTGVVEVDTQIAHLLLRLVQALRLLGCEMMITGISASVAQAMTRFGVNLEAVVTAGSLQKVLSRWMAASR